MRFSVLVYPQVCRFSDYFTGNIGSIKDEGMNWQFGLLTSRSITVFTTCISWNDSGGW